MGRKGSAVETTYGQVSRRTAPHKNALAQSAASSSLGFSQGNVQILGSGGNNYGSGNSGSQGQISVDSNSNSVINSALTYVNQDSSASGALGYSGGSSLGAGSLGNSGIAGGYINVPSYGPSISSGYSGLSSGYSGIASTGYSGSIGYSAGNVISSSGAGYGGQGIGELSINGELPVKGLTNIEGNLPILGIVSFNGNLPASGVVTISGCTPCLC